MKNPFSALCSLLWRNVSIFKAFDFIEPVAQIQEKSHSVIWEKILKHRTPTRLTYRWIIIFDFRKKEQKSNKPLCCSSNEPTLSLKMKISFLEGAAGSRVLKIKSHKRTGCYQIFGEKNYQFWRNELCDLKKKYMQQIESLKNTS